MSRNRLSSLPLSRRTWATAHGWETADGAHPFHDISVICQWANAGVVNKLNAQETVDLRYYGSDKHTLGYTYQPGLIASVRIKY